jgi:hypothetical protein
MRRMTDKSIHPKPENQTTKSLITRVNPTVIMQYIKVRIGKTLQRMESRDSQEN